MSFKICSIGCGRHASTAHGPSLRRYASERDRVELAACCDLNREAADNYAKSFGFNRTYNDIDVMLDREKPDAVCLVLPVSLTPRIALPILERGIPLLLEKPPALTGEDLKPLIRAAEKGGVPNRVAFNRRYTPLIAELKERINRVLPGESLHGLSYYMGRNNRRDPDFSTTAIHAIDAVRFLTESDYKEITFHYHELPGLGTGVTNILMEGVMTSGTKVTLEFFPAAGVLLERVRVHGLDHTLMLEVPMFGGFDSPGRLQHFCGGDLKETLTGHDITDGEESFEASGFYRENASFFDALMAGKKINDGVKNALQSVEVAQCIRERRKKYTKH